MNLKKRKKKKSKLMKQMSDVKEIDNYNENQLSISDNII